MWARRLSQGSSDALLSGASVSRGRTLALPAHAWRICEAVTSVISVYRSATTIIAATALHTLR